MCLYNFIRNYSSICIFTNFNIFVFDLHQLQKSLIIAGRGGKKLVLSRVKCRCNIFKIRWRSKKFPESAFVISREIFILSLYFVALKYIYFLFTRMIFVFGVLVKEFFPRLNDTNVGRHKSMERMSEYCRILKFAAT